MEEKKTIEMGVAKGEERQKLCYEQLNEACSQLFQQNQQLRSEVNRLNTFNAFRRLDYLFKVVELSDKIKDGEFVAQCVDELKEAMTVGETEESNTEEAEG